MSQYEENGSTGPTHTWACQSCGQTVERYRGEGDVECACGAQYNSFGQRLRDDWRGNQSNYDEEVGDLEGFELQQLGEEGFGSNYAY
jgi:protein-arginine kinase activator protein McsA